jgi:hypothetical protein
LVDELYQPGIRHALDEDTFRQRIHGTKDLSVAAVLEQVGWFFVPQCGVGAEQPVVGRLGAESRRKPLDYREEFKKTLARFPAWGCLLLEPPAHCPRVGSHDAGDFLLIQICCLESAF